MASFTNTATLTYSGGQISSNTVTGELQELLTANKTATPSVYSPGDTVTYVVNLINAGAAPLNGLTVTDNLGAYPFNASTLYPLGYVPGSVRYFVNGALQAAPTVAAGPPLTVSGISVPAGGNAAIIYDARLNAYAPPGAAGSVTNTAAVTGAGVTPPVTAQAVVTASAAAQPAITKAMSPSVVQEGSQLTYTFTVQNYGPTAITAADNVVISDTFSPILETIAVTWNGTAWSPTANYTYNSSTGEFATVAGGVTVPAATVTQNADGTWAVTPGTGTLVVTGTV